MDNINESRQKLEIIINTEVDMMILWGHGIAIGRPYNICLNSTEGYKNLRIEFEGEKEVKHAEELYSGIKTQIQNRNELVVGHYHNMEKLTEGVTLKIPMLEYNLRIV